MSAQETRRSTCDIHVLADEVTIDAREEVNPESKSMSSTFAFSFAAM